MKKVLVAVIGVVIVLGTTFYIAGNAQSKKSHGENATTSSKQHVTHSHKKQRRASSQAEMASQSAPSQSASNNQTAGSAAINGGSSSMNGQSNAADDHSQAENNAAANSQSSTTSHNNQPNQDNAGEGITPTEGQGHAVYNGNDAIDVIRQAFQKAVGSGESDFEYNVTIDAQNPNAFDVGTIVKSYVAAGGDGAAGVYRVDSNGHFEFIS
ncbi:hypothetical protein PT274_02695 [Leuconostocaceae bacterium ESL0958]|nr:hypothetical protein [Leuconostocaceae bacterium ESL0958]